MTATEEALARIGAARRNLSHLPDPGVDPVFVAECVDSLLGEADAWLRGQRG